MTARRLREGGWCARWECCRAGVDVPVWEGGGQAMLCKACEHERLVEEAEEESQAA